MANNHLAPDAVAQAGYRFAMVILALPVEGLMKGALASSDDEQAESPAECVPASSWKPSETLRGAWKSCEPHKRAFCGRRPLCTASSCRRGEA
jgi:hypothetical protein